MDENGSNVDARYGQRPHRTFLWIGLGAGVMAVLVVLTGGWLMLRWIDDGMTGVHVSEDKNSARRLAQGLGLELRPGDRIVYGEYQSSFPDSGSYLVVETRTPADRDRLLTTSAMGCGPESRTPGSQHRSRDDHGPGESATLIGCHSAVSGAGVLSAEYDPADGTSGTRIYIQASQM
ncbi:hypothetical protein ACQ7HM_13045 [Williamsia sp. MIQD14]|uniref:hypothetical protein n=1 Tax=Williamsia sp. MIQD14 TaxID=3425703 RepID=UPI003DA1AE83